MLTIFLLIPIATSISIVGHYGFGNWSYVGQAYYCYPAVQDITTQNVIIDGLGGDHVSGKTSDDVTLFSIWNKSCYYIPKGIDKLYKNLEFIEFGKCGLRVVSGDDLKPFTKLKVLWLADNQLTTLDAGLFEFNTNLKSISFRNNKISLIDQTIFDPIENLEKAEFSENFCVSKDGEGSDQVKAVIREVIEKCRSSRKDQNLVEKIAKLEKEVEKLRTAVARVSGDIDQLTTFT